MSISNESRTFDVVDGDGSQLELTGRCSRPGCRDEFPIPVTPGRRRQYCSATCKHLAERDYKRAKAAVDHYDRLLRDARSDLATFGRNDDELPTADDATKRLRAEVAVREQLAKAEGALAFAAPGDERLFGMLTDFAAAVSRFIRSEA